MSPLIWTSSLCSCSHSQTGGCCGHMTHTSQNSLHSAHRQGKLFSHSPCFLSTSASTSASGQVRHGRRRGSTLWSERPVMGLWNTWNSLTGSRILTWARPATATGSPTTHKHMRYLTRKPFSFTNAWNPYFPHDCRLLSGSYIGIHGKNRHITFFRDGITQLKQTGMYKCVCVKM